LSLRQAKLTPIQGSEMTKGAAVDGALRA